MCTNNLLILGCSDSLYWYRRSIGRVFPLLRDVGQDWLSREHSGLTNIIDKRDAVVIPSGFKLAATDSLLQNGDLILVERRWAMTSLDDWGQLVGIRSVIRPALPKP